MAENKGYIISTMDNGRIMISDEVLASIAGNAVREVEGIYGLSSTSTLDLSTVFRKTNLKKGIKVTIDGQEATISCNLIVKMGEEVMVVAKNVQEAIMTQIEDMTGIRAAAVNVKVVGVAVPKEKA